MASTRRTLRTIPNRGDDVAKKVPGMAGQAGKPVGKVGGVKRYNESSQENIPHNKRSAFGDLTNAYIGKQGSQQTKKSSKIPQKVKVKVHSDKTLSSSNECSDSSQGSQQSHLSQSSASSQECNSSSQSSDSDIEFKSVVKVQSSLETVETVVEAPKVAAIEEITDQLDFVDIDKENINDPYHCPLYANDIFKYYKSREAQFKVNDYMPRQKSLSANMRAILVDWMVEVQENFELNHETLYLAIKLVDQYLCKKAVARENLQLVGSTALLIACKYDERCPPLVDDFLYICDDAYTRPQLLRMEMSMLKAIGYDLGIPLSYRFLRRYAKCAKSTMETLTLSRFILELSLMEYDFLKHDDSKMAAACLLLAFKMKKVREWDSQMIHYSGYKQEDLMPLVFDLNAMIAAPISKNLATVRSKYSHEVFYEVAKTPAMDIMELS